MIYEFALDPEVLNNWESFRYFIEKFGVEHGRLISRFPRHWKKMVYDVCKSCKDIERKRIEVRLEKIDVKLVNSGRPYNDQMNWLENAEEQHSTKPFQAIISRNNPRYNSCVLVADDLDDTNAIWYVPRGKVIERKAEFIANEVRRLIEISNSVLVVDYVYDPIFDKWQKTLEYLLEIACQNPSIKRFEIHTSVYIKSGYEEPREVWEKKCNDYIPKIVPLGFSIKLFRWRHRDDRLHARYLLTERGGIKIDVGFDETDGATTDIDLQDRNQYEKRWKDYQEETSPFELDCIIKIDGLKNDTSSLDFTNQCIK